MKQRQYDISGTFGTKKIKIDIRFKQNSKILVLLLHGAYGKPYHTKPTIYERLSKELGRSVSIGFYETSRFFSWKDEPTLTFERYRDQSFGYKTWEEEKKAMKEEKR